MQHAFGAALAACLTLAGAAAQAASTASASATLSNLQIQLIDLDPDDGIAPFITFAPSEVSNQGWASASFRTPQEAQSSDETFSSQLGPWQPGSAQAATTLSMATAMLSGNGTANGTNFLASGQATSPGDTVYLPPLPGTTGAAASFFATVRAPASFSGNSFTLSPSTIAVFSVAAEVQGAAIGGGTQDFSGGFVVRAGNFASARASMFVFGPAASGGPGSQTSRNERNLWLSSSYNVLTGDWINAIDSVSVGLGVSFTNLTAAPMLGNLEIVVIAEGVANGNLSPIPEPATWALLLGGLALVGRAAARRR